MNRRAFLCGLAVGTPARPLTVEAQVQRIGVLMGFAESDPRARARFGAFREGLQALGWAEGRNIQIDIRWAMTSDAAAMQRFAKELSRCSPI